MLKLVKRPGSPFWIARGTVDGRRVERSTGERDKGAAKHAIPGLVAALTASRIDPAEGLRFDQAVALYLDHRPNARFLEPLLSHFGRTPVAGINQAALRFAANRLYPGAKPATLRRQVWTPVKAILNHAADDELCAPPRLKAPSGGARRTVFVMPEEANAIIRALRGAWLPAMVTFLFAQGCRMGETITLDGRDVSLDGGFALLRNTKNGEERRVTLTARTKAALSVLPTLGHAGPLFRREDGAKFRETGSSGGQIQWAFGKAVEATGMDPERVTPHVCRHSWATWFYAETLDPMRLKIEGGWKSAEWERYVKLATPDLGRLAIEAGWDFRPESGEERGSGRLKA